MHSPNTLSSRPLRTKKRKLWRKPFFPNGFVNSASQYKFTQTGGKEFVNKLSKELFDLLNVEHTKMTPAHPQCNAQVEVFNKTVTKYLAALVDDTTLDWENFLPALMLSYNTSYHSTIATMPFELLFGSNLVCHRFQIQTFNECTMANQLWGKDISFYKR
jgi:hypothetical protein